MLIDDLRDVEIQCRTLSWLVGQLGETDMSKDYAYGLYLLGNGIADKVKAVELKIQKNEIYSPNIIASK